MFKLHLFPDIHQNIHCDIYRHWKTLTHKYIFSPWLDCNNTDTQLKQYKSHYICQQPTLSCIKRVKRRSHQFLVSNDVKSSTTRAPLNTYTQNSWQGFLPTGAACGLRKEMWVRLPSYCTSKACQLEEAENLSSKDRRGRGGETIWKPKTNFSSASHSQHLLPSSAVSSNWKHSHINSSFCGTVIRFTV